MSKHRQKISHRNVFMK